MHPAISGAMEGAAAGTIACGLLWVVFSTTNWFPDPDYRLGMYIGIFTGNVLFYTAKSIILG